MCDIVSETCLYLAHFFPAGQHNPASLKASVLTELGGFVEALLEAMMTNSE